MAFAYILPSCFRTLKGIQSRTATFCPGTGATDIHKPQTLMQPIKCQKERGKLAPKNHAEKVEVILVGQFSK